MHEKVCCYCYRYIFRYIYLIFFNFDFDFTLFRIRNLDIYPVGVRGGAKKGCYYIKPLKIKTVFPSPFLICQ